MSRARRIGVDLVPKNLTPGHRLIAPRRGIQYLIVRATRDKIQARMRRGTRGRWSREIYELVPATLIGYKVEG